MIGCLSFYSDIAQITHTNTHRYFWLTLVEYLLIIFKLPSLFVCSFVRFFRCFCRSIIFFFFFSFLNNKYECTEDVYVCLFHRSIDRSMMMMIIYDFGQLDEPFSDSLLFVNNCFVLFCFFQLLFSFCIRLDSRLFN